MSVSKNAIVAGHICLDIIPTLPDGSESHLCRPGHLLQVGPATISTGGPVSNTGLALHKLGIPVKLVAKVGADTLGETVRTILQQHGADLTSGIVSDPGIGTSYSIIVNPPGLDRTFWHYPGANDAFCAADIPWGLVNGASLFHFGYPPVMRQMYTDGGNGLLEVFRRAKATGITTSLDLCVPDPDSEAGKTDWRAIYRAVLPYVDIFLPSLDELMFTLRRQEFDRRISTGDLLDAITPGLLSDICSEVIDLGVKIVVLKLGNQGLYLETAGPGELASMGHAAPKPHALWARRRIWAPCFLVKEVGTTGSGDATIAGFLSALLRGCQPAAAMTAAVAVGACNVEAADALSGIRSWEETLSRVAGGWPRRALNIHSEEWRRDTLTQIWFGPDRQE
jgi:sugar/nucleoside kinase (ribokinase family)